MILRTISFLGIRVRTMTPKYPAERVPFPRRDGLTASIRALGHGESFLIPENDVKPTTRRIVHAAAVRLDIPISARRVENGLRVYRLAEWPRRGVRQQTASEPTYQPFDET
jgi:hypothetical protein